MTLLQTFPAVLEEGVVAGVVGLHMQETRCGARGRVLVSGMSMKAQWRVMVLGLLWARFWEEK